MAYATISKPSLHFNTKLYSGNSSTQAITGVGFQPDFTWVKERNAAEHHYLFDSVRGVTKFMYSNLTNAEATNANSLTAFGADGFTLGNYVDVNESGKTYASWNWKAGGSSSANTDGTVNTTVSANTTAGFSVVTYTGDGNNDATFGHGLGAVPRVVVVKTRDNARNWYMRHEDLGSGYNIMWNLTEARINASSYNAGIIKDLNNANTFSIAKSGSTNPTNNNGTGENYVAYCFAEKAGFSKFGSYIGNGNVNGPFIYTGFKPALIILKKRSQTQSWPIQDNKRNPINNGGNMIASKTDSNAAEENEASHRIDYLSNGFKMRYNWEGNNQSGQAYIYLAFAEEPLVANVGASIPATAR